MLYMIQFNEMCKDEARHGKAFLGLLERYFGEYKK